MSKWDIVYENKIFNLESIDKGIIISEYFYSALPLEEQESHSNPHCAEQQRNNNGSTFRQDEKSLQILF